MIKLNQFGVTTKEKINELENKYNLILPDDYKTFLLSNNGGIVEKDESNGVFVEDINEQIIIDVFYGVDTGQEKANINYWMDSLLEDLLEDTVIIGDDIIQGLILIICSGENAGVYYWDDAYNFDGSDEEVNTYWIADSFTDFIAMFK
ncbi:hypothetical protein IGL98_000225 [Enterococcus sp. DIV0840]|uniref:SMI1/KNR4 family protein n=1 Tax=unclassified Enterococcus TaxID=2608891 RepID=UPI001A8F83E8|nr:SMI1/KNR4 family protein [Enterococcus sp. DIV0849a]MBO0434685.1 SMI1/KNR4 family protein [Enterococcus sp. DIV0849a]